MKNLPAELAKILLYDLVEDGDPKLAELLYSLGVHYAQLHYEPSEEFMAEIERRRQAYLEGKEKAYSLEEAKERLSKSLTDRSSKKNQLYRLVRDADEATVERLLSFAEKIARANDNEI